MKNANLNIKTATAKLVKDLPDRARDVLIGRFGLDGKNPQTLEAIGKKYGITRERVRQIEAHGLSKLRTSPAIAHAAPIFDWLKSQVDAHAGVIGEEYFLGQVLKNNAHENHVRFFTELGDDFDKGKETDDLRSHIVTDKNAPQKIKKALEALHASLDEEPLTQEEMTVRLASYVEGEDAKNLPENVLTSWLHLSKHFAQNNLGEWGLASSPNIKPRGMRDLAYLVMKKHGSPLHFREVSKRIKDTTGKKAHEQTVHNELIKDKRFVLVGRGMYALSEWGYKKGVVRDVIASVLKSEGPLSKDQLIKKVLQERYVKENTILINLQDKKYFKKLTDGTFALA